MTITPSLRGRALPRDILNAVVDRLRSKIEGASDQNCFVSDQPIPVSLPGGGGFAITVAMGGANFPQEFWSGGGHQTATTDGAILVTAFIRSALDRPSQAKVAMLDNERGLISIVHKIIRSLVVDDVSQGKQSSIWEPVVGSKPLLRDPLFPQSMSDPGPVADHSGWTGSTIRFSCVFDWDLYQ